MPPSALDRTDRRILDALQRHGRLPMTELAQEVGLSTSPVTERVRRLEREGVITGYHARIDPAKLGRPLLVFVELTLSSKSGELFEKLRNELMHEPRVLECHLVSGRFDYLIKMRLSAMSEYEPYSVAVSGVRSLPRILPPPSSKPLMNHVSASMPGA